MPHDERSTQMMLVSLRSKSGGLTISQVQHRYGIDDAEIDDQFGVIEVDDVEHIYTIRVTAEAAARIDESFRGLGEMEGSYGDVRIEPFGPV